MQCTRENCELTALWQIGFDMQPINQLTQEPLHGWMSLAVCGLCKELVTLDDFKETVTELCAVIGRRYGMEFRPSLVFYDISNGYWTDPRQGKKVQVPHGRLPYHR